MKGLRHLNAAMRLESPFGNGMCIHRSVALVLDVPGSELVFGTFVPGKPTEEEIAFLNRRGAKPSTVPFIHAWVEYKGVVFAPTTIERTGGELVPQHREGYYKVNGAKDIKRLGWGAVMLLVQKHGLIHCLTVGGPPPDGSASFGGIFLDAAGVQCATTPDGGIIPA